MDSFKPEILTANDITKLLSLQRENLKINLEPDAIDSQGFVSFVYDPQIIQNMMDTAPQIIVKKDGELVGYALSTTLPVGLTIPLMQPLIEMTETLDYEGIPLSKKRYYIMGQVCVKMGYRGLGLFDLLYKGHKQYLSPNFDYVVTEIADDNKRSLAAHKRVGFKTIHEYFDEVSQKHWHIVLWDWS